MCFTTSIFNFKKIAKEDIVCYKIGYILTSEDPTIDKTIFSSYTQGHFYEENINQPIMKIKRKFSWFWLKYDIYVGYHSFVSFPFWQINEDQNTTIEKFIIPKGTVYYKKNPYYVSEIIIWVRN